MDGYTDNIEKKYKNKKNTYADGAEKKRPPRTYERAKSYSFYLLEHKMRTKKELADKLTKAEYPQEIVAQTVDYMEELGYINDKDYAERYTKDSFALKKSGEFRIKRELALKGIDKEVAEEIIENSDLDFAANLKKLIAKKAERMDLSDIKEKNRLFAFLARKGYRSSDIQAAMSEYILYKSEEFDI
jgi:regulatory protein